MKYLLLLSLFTVNAFANRWVIESKRPLTDQEVKTLKLEAFYPKTKSKYFKRLYTLDAQIENAINVKRLSSLFINVEPVFPVSTFNITPNPASERTVLDGLFPYQWGLYNQEQLVNKSEDDIRSKNYQGVRGIDIGFKEIAKLQLKKRPLVAVVDTGVDLTHPELIHALEKNQIECDSTDKTKDMDNNGFPGDCDGWNFTAPLNSDGGKNPQDIVGHGTHIAGIIAAKNNNQGIVGISDNIRILPVKVLLDGEGESTNDPNRLDISDRLAKGIVYATDRGADVINLSLGWPRSRETNYLREAILYALKKNVILVAAAGNNNSIEPIFPCATEGVICVGAVTNTGKIAGFSNYGSVVDVLAPGEAILSTVPQSLEPDLFNVVGYDIKNGTSQAAPMVSAAMAILKAQSPDVSVIDLKAKLLTSTKKTNEQEKYSQFGLINMSSLLNGEKVDFLIRPQMKAVKQLIYILDDQNQSFSIPFVNDGASKENVNVTIESLSSTIEILDGTSVIDSFAAKTFKNVKVNYRITDVKAHSLIKLRVTVSNGENNLSYLTEIPLVRDIRKDPRVNTRGFVFQNERLPVGDIRNGILTPMLYTIDQLYPQDQAEFYMRKLSQADKILTLIVFKNVDNNLVEQENKVVVPNFQQFVSFSKMDVNYDRKLDYVLQYIAIEKLNNPETNELEDREVLHYYFYNENLEPLFDEPYSHWKFIPNVAAINETNKETLRYLPFELENVGRVAIPVFSEIGRLTSEDQDPSVWVREDRSRRERVYVLTPVLEQGIIHLKTRTFTSPSFHQKAESELEIAFGERLDFIAILHQSKSSFYNGTVDILFSKGAGMFRDLKKLSLSIENKYEWSYYADKKSRLEGMFRKNLFDLTKENYSHEGDIFSGFYDNSIARLISIQEGSQNNLSNLIYRHDSKVDALLGTIGSFKEEGQISHFVTSKSRLILVQEKDGKTKTYTRPILRFSFLPGRLLSELYLAIYIKDSETKRPALYVDSTQITGNRIYVLVSEPNGLVVPADKSIFVPGTCKAMVPIQNENQTSFQYNFLCFENEQWFLKSLPLE